VEPAHRFEVRRVAVAPGGTRPYDDAEWRDALVFVVRGRIELEGLSGRRRTFERGAVLWLVGLPLRALHNHGRESAVMVAFTRQR
jgi:quercetin dioxygenase-like cupin family protein